MAVWKVPVLAFADDVVLLGADEREAQRQVGVLHEYLSGLGMTISRDKSQTFQVVAKEDTWFVKEPTISLQVFRRQDGVLEGRPLWHSSARDSEHGEKSKEALLETMSEDRIPDKIYILSVLIQPIDLSTRRRCPKAYG